MNTHTHNPDKWVIIKITTNGESLYKVLGGWYGGYLDGDSYRMNSGISGIEEKDDSYIISGYSGSSYICEKSNQGFTNLTSDVYNSITKLDDIVIELIDDITKVDIING